ncbi:hypothetical protein BC828DRAFT_395561 [Blastocladiella britannica]|nr:hypothetical protein BC828DRAFT_395561 [Blastocladiella britannica]
MDQSEHHHEPVPFEETPFSEYLAEFGLVDELEAALPATDPNNVPAADHSPFRRVLATAALATTIATVYFSSRSRFPLGFPTVHSPWILSSAACAVAVVAVTARPLTRTVLRWRRRRHRAHLVHALATTWNDLDALVAARMRYLREVDVVYRGYRLQAVTSAGHVGQDSYLKPDLRRLLATHLASMCTLSSQVLARTSPDPDPDLEDAVADLVGRAVPNPNSLVMEDGVLQARAPTPTLVALRELADCARMLVDLAIRDLDAWSSHTASKNETIDSPVWGLAKSLVDAAAAAQLALVRHDPSGPVPSSSSSSSLPASTALAETGDRGGTPDRVRAALTHLHAHLHTMTVKAHVAMADDPHARAGELHRMAHRLAADLPGDLDHLRVLHAQLSALLASQGSVALPEPRDDGGGDEVAHDGIEQGHRITAAAEEDDDSLDPLFADGGWVVEADLDDPQGEEAHKRGPRLTREQRIAQQQQRRQQQTADQVTSSASRVMMGELQAVLEHRQVFMGPNTVPVVTTVAPPVVTSQLTDALESHVMAEATFVPSEIDTK